MEIFGGFMVMISILSLFVAVVWLVMPFVVFAIKGKQDRTLEVLESIDKRLTALECRLRPQEPDQNQPRPDEGGTSAEPVPPLDRSGDKPGSAVPASGSGSSSAE
jgi:hypothetical protein